MIPMAIPETKAKAGAVIIPIRQPEEAKIIPKFVITPFYSSIQIRAFQISPAGCPRSAYRIYLKLIIHKAINR